MALKCCTKLNVVQRGALLFFEVIHEISWSWGTKNAHQGHTGWLIDNLNPTWVRLLGWSQLSNPSDLPCYIHCSFLELKKQTKVVICIFGKFICYVIDKTAVFVFSNPDTILGHIFPLNSLNSWRCQIIFKVWFSNSLYKIVTWALAVKFVLYECQKTLLMMY